MLARYLVEELVQIYNVWPKRSTDFLVARACVVGAHAGIPSLTAILCRPTRPSFRDGVIANAVDAATQDHNTLYFSAAGSSGTGRRFVSVSFE